MNHHGQLKIVNFISLLCFAVAIGCLVSIYSHLRSVRETLADTRQQLSASPEHTRLTVLERECLEFKERHAEVEKTKTVLESDLQACRNTLAAQKEDLKNAAEQIRKLSAPDKP